MGNELKSFFNVLLTPVAFLAEGVIGLIEENAHDSLLHLDKNGRIIKTNKQSGKAWGYTRKELLEMALRDLFADAEQFDRMLEELTVERKTIGTTVLLRTRDGSIAHSLLHGVWLPDQDHVLVILHSISEENLRELDAQRET